MSFKWTFDLGKTGPVFIERDGGLYEAILIGARGSWDYVTKRMVEWYKVDYINPLFPNEEVIVDRIHRGDASPVTQMIDTGTLVPALYDLATQAAIDEMVDAHNKWRAEVGVPPVRWDAQLAREAQEWADKLLCLDVLKHSSHEERDGKGENLYWSSNPNVTPTAVVDAWGNEKYDYDYDSNSCTSVCGHYTQVVWRETKKIGAAVAKDGDDVYWVCRYDPPGNVIGRRPY